MPQTTDNPLYFGVMHAIEQMTKTVKGLQYPLDEKKKKEMKVELESTMELCKTYMRTKDRDQLQDEEKRRYEDVAQSYDFCKRQMELFDLQQASAEAEMYTALNKRKDENTPIDRDEALTAFSGMVLQEMVKMGRSVDENGTQIASPLEQALAASPEFVMQSIRNHSYFQAVTENLSADAFSAFVAGDGARVVAAKMMKRAEGKAPDVEEQLDKEKELDRTKCMLK